MLSIDTGRDTRLRPLLRIHKSRNAIASSDSKATDSSEGPHRRGRTRPSGSIKNPRAVVLTFTVKDTGVPPDTTAEGGEAVQLPAGGGLLQPKIMVPEKPLTGATCKLMVAVCPAANMADVVPFAAGLIWKSVAVPVSDTLGFVAALSLRVSVAVRAPEAIGRKLTSTVQFPPTATVTLVPFAPMRFPEA